MRVALDVPTVSSALAELSLPYAGVEFHPRLGSTNERAVAAATPWLVVVTDHQIAGRGRLSRGWDVPDRAALCVSVALPVADDAGIPVANLGWVPLLTGLAMADGVADVTSLQVGLKWPNDVLVGDDEWRKVCGVLCEFVSPAQLVVAGAGLNVDQTRAELPIDGATSLALCGADVSREEVLTAYLVALAKRHTQWVSGAWGEPSLSGDDPHARGGEGPADLRSDYRARCRTIGAEVVVHLPGGARAEGVARGVDDEGQLVVEGCFGVRTFSAGDVVHVRPGPLALA